MDRPGGAVLGRMNAWSALAGPLNVGLLSRMGEHPINVSPESLGRLKAIRAAAKFHARSLYPGAPDEATRVDAERAVNQMLDRLIVGLPKSPSKTFVLSEFQAMLRGCEEH